MIYIVAAKKLNVRGEPIKNAKRKIVLKIEADSIGIARTKLQEYIVEEGDCKHRYELLTGNWKPTTPMFEKSKLERNGWRAVYEE